jgi:hypothetical protein
MYAWLWHRLPFGTRGRIAIAAAVILAVAALLWFVVFPAIDPLLPFNQDPTTPG